MLQQIQSVLIRASGFGLAQGGVDKAVDESRLVKPLDTHRETFVFGVCSGVHQPYLVTGIVDDLSLCFESLRQLF